jgi:CO dehydrogenase maturation factor
MGKSYLIVNQVKGELSPKVTEIIEKSGIELAGTIPEDEGVYDFDLDGRPTIDLSEENPAVKAAFDIFDRIIT